MARVILLTGGNLGDVKRTLQSAQQLINSRIGAVLHCSHRYESEPWGFADAPEFFNQALEVSTDLSPLEVLDAVQRIECELGRNRAAETLEQARTGASYVSRPIDIDILFYDDETLPASNSCLAQKASVNHAQKESMHGCPSQKSAKDREPKHLANWFTPMYGDR